MHGIGELQEGKGPASGPSAPPSTLPHRLYSDGYTRPTRTFSSFSSIKPQFSSSPTVESVMDWMRKDRGNATAEMPIPICQSRRRESAKAVRTRARRGSSLYGHEAIS